MQKTIGKITSIINDQQVLISSETQLYDGQVVYVVEEVSSDLLKKQSGLQTILIPKGQLKIGLQQDEHIYLASTFRETKNKKKVIVRDPFIGAFSTVFGKTEEIITTEYGKWSANVDTSKSLKVDIPKLIAVGDKIILE